MATRRISQGGARRRSRSFRDRARVLALVRAAPRRRLALRGANDRTLVAERSDQRSDELLSTVDQGCTPCGSECDRRPGKPRPGGQRLQHPHHLASDRSPALSAPVPRAVDAQGRAPGRSVYEAHRTVGHWLSPERLRRAPGRSNRPAARVAGGRRRRCCPRRRRGHTDRRHPASRRPADAAARRRPRSFALPSEREESLVLPQPSAADDAAYAVEAAALREAYAVRAQRQLDGLEQRLLSLEEQ